MVAIVVQFRRLPHVLLIPALLISSIATNPVMAARPAKMTDNCEIYRKPFEQIKNYQLNKILGGVAKGILAGIGLAIVEGLTSNEYERDANGRVIIGRNGKPKKKAPNVVGYAVAGAAAGGLIGWFSSLKQNARNQEELQAAVAQGFREDIDQFSPLPQKLADLGNCRRAQIFGVQTSFQRKEVDAATAGKQLDAIEKWIAKDDQLISKAAKMQSNTVGAYVRATAMADGQDPETVDKSESQILATFEAQSTAYEPVVAESYVDPQGGTIDVPPPPPPTETRYVVGRKGVNLRSQANTAASVIKLLPAGTPVETRPSPVQGWLEATTGGATGFINEAAVSSQPPRGQPRVAAPVRAAPPPPPPPDKAAKKLIVRPPRSQPAKPRDRTNQAVATRVTLTRVIAQNNDATAAQLAAARRALES